MVLVELGSLTVAALGAYLGLWLAQRALWSNGLTPSVPPLFPRPGADAALGTTQTGVVVLLGLLVCGLFLWVILRAPRYQAARLGWVALIAPLLIAVGQFLLPPTLSIDTYSYLSHGYLAATSGANPYVQTSASVGGTGYGHLLAALGWQAVHPQTPYGPLWTAFERVAFEISGRNVPLGILIIKLPLLLAVIGTAGLISSLLRRIAPGRRLRGVLLFLANPIVLLDLVGDGHNDALVIVLVVLAVAACERRWAAVALLALGLAVLVKVSVLPLALPLLVALATMRRSSGRLLAEGVTAVVVVTGIAIALIAPYWVGLPVLDGLRASGSPGPGWTVSGAVGRLLGGGEGGERAAIVQLILAALLVVGTSAAALIARSTEGLIRACAIVGLVTLLLLPIEWPWYGALPTALLALGAGGWETAAIIVLAVGARLIAPLGDASTLAVVGTDVFTRQQALIGQGVPAATGLVLLLLCPLLVRRRRNTSRPTQTPADSG